MTLPKNKNIRKIKVDDVEYYWNIDYDEDYGIIGCNVGLVEQPNYRFSFARGADDNHKRYIHNGIEKEEEVKAITPSMVRSAIVYANKNMDWKNSKPSNLPYDSKWFQME